MNHPSVKIYIHIVYPTLIHIVLSNYLNSNSCLKYFSNTIYNNQCNYIILLLILYTLPYLQLLTLIYIHYTYIHIYIYIYIPVFPHNTSNNVIISPFLLPTPYPILHLQQVVSFMNDYSLSCTLLMVLCALLSIVTNISISICPTQSISYLSLFPFCLHWTSHYIIPSAFFLSPFPRIIYHSYLTLPPNIGTHLFILYIYIPVQLSLTHCTPQTLFYYNPYAVQ